jgi:hypothetical protein
VKLYNKIDKKLLSNKIVGIISKKTYLKRIKMKKLQFLFLTLFTSTLFANPMMRQMLTPHVDVYKVTPQKL